MDPGSVTKKLKTELPSVKKTSSNLVAQAFGSDVRGCMKYDHIKNLFTLAKLL